MTALCDSNSDSDNDNDKHGERKRVALMNDYFINLFFNNVCIWYFLY